jgi:hypothetical protein
MPEVTCSGRSAEAQRAADRASRPGSGARFDAALERAGRGEATQAGGRAGQAEAEGGPGAAVRLAEPARSARSARRAALARRQPAGAAEGSAPGPGSAGGAGAPGPPQPSAAEPQPTRGAQELGAAVRTLPAAVAARSAGSLALSFGSALTVDLRAGAMGLELTLHPAQALGQAARAELPGLVDALRARGLRVARADIRPRAAGAPGPRAR